jgi:hypothetical protein
LAQSIGALSQAGYRPVYVSRIFCRKLYLPTVSQISLFLTSIIAIEEHTSDRTGYKKSLKYSYSSLFTTHKTSTAASSLQSMDMSKRDISQADCISFENTGSKCNTFPLSLSTLEIWTISQTKKKISDRTEGFFSSADYCISK